MPGQSHQATPDAENELPEGWAEAELGSLCHHPQYGWTTSDAHPDIEPASQLLGRIRSERRTSVAGVKRKRGADLPARMEAEGELPTAWIWASLSELLHYTGAAGYGVLQPGPHMPDGVPMVRVCDIDGGAVRVDQLKHIAADIDAQYRRTRLEGNEVLVTLVGTIGRTAVVPEAAEGANIARAVAMLPLCPHAVPEFVRYTRAEPGQNAELVDLAREVARKTLNLGLLKAVVVPLAPLDEQQEIVRQVEALFKLADTIEQRVQAGTQRAHKLTQSVLAKAFRGELVPTEAELARREGRDYEPASVLLERINAEREAVKITRPRRAARVRSKPSR